MKRRGIKELLGVMVLVSLWMAWQANQDTPASELQSSDVQEEASELRIFTINGVKLGDSLTQIEAKFGPSLTPPEMEEGTDYTYQFGSVEGAMGFLDFTVVQVDSQQKAIMIQGNRLELNGDRLVEEFDSLDELAKTATLERLNSLLEPVLQEPLRAGQFQDFPQYDLSVAIGEQGRWSFRLQDS